MPRRSTISSTCRSSSSSSVILTFFTICRHIIANLVTRTAYIDGGDGHTADSGFPDILHSSMQLEPDTKLGRLVSFALVLALGPSVRAADRPNILLFLSDDQRHDQIGRGRSGFANPDDGPARDRRHSLHECFRHDVDLRRESRDDPYRTLRALASVYVLHSTARSWVDGPKLSRPSSSRRLSHRFRRQDRRAVRARCRRGNVRLLRDTRSQPVLS